MFSSQQSTGLGSGMEGQQGVRGLNLEAEKNCGSIERD
jgi:hypothetical protein